MNLCACEMFPANKQLILLIMTSGGLPPGQFTGTGQKEKFLLYLCHSAHRQFHVSSSPTYLQVCVEDPDEGADRRVAAGFEDHKPSRTVFSPDASMSREREGQRGKQPWHYWLTGSVLRPDKATARRLAFVDGCHAGGHVAVALPFHPSDINKVPGRRETSHSRG